MVARGDGVLLVCGFVLESMVLLHVYVVSI
jgi:hypothetical protein